MEQTSLEELKQNGRVRPVYRLIPVSREIFSDIRNTRLQVLRTLQAVSEPLLYAGKCRRIQQAVGTLHLSWRSIPRWS